MKRMHGLAFSIAAALALPAALSACKGASAEAGAPADAAVLVPATAQTEATASGETNAAVLLRDATDPASARVIATAALGGLESYGIDGKRVATAAAGEAGALDVATGVALGPNRVADVVATIDTTGNYLRLFLHGADGLVEAGARPLPLGFAAEGICLYQHPLDRSLHAFIVGDGGEVDQQVIFAAADGKLDARQVRRINLPSPLKQCVVDGEGRVFASEEAVGIWRFNADPEAEVAATLVDAPRLGHITGEVSGLAVHDGGEGHRWLLASDASAGRINVYDRDRDGAYLGSFRVAAPGQGGEPVEEPNLLFADSRPLGAGFPAGVLLVNDEDGANTKLVSLADVGKALGLDPGKAAAAAAPPKVAAVTASAETVPVASYGDAADDPAIWAHPTDPARSLVVATDKKAGLYLYDMQGQVLQFLPDGKMNNVDLREDFDLDGQPVVLVTASNRTDKSIAIYRLDTQKRQLVAVADGVQPTGLGDPYGLCMYRAAGGDTYVFVNGDDTRMRQWRLVAGSGGKVRAEHVRDLEFDSQTEGCVVDDANGTLYINEEDVALWKLAADPAAGDNRTAVVRVADNPALKDDLEGIGMYDLGDGRGYLVFSSQGNDTYAVFRREGKQEYLGSFAVVADPVRGIDGISETDGLEVTSRNLGPGFEHGAMVAQDGRNVMPVENQNYKYVSWERIARALDLEMR
ncbi:phytase [Pseudoxanthomonas suwonensis]|uniref:phytase n=1 Tax=Pseudoxanthomonas suwonensis TaxID=314722 RepID=UPI0004657838|nr:phytase [Pseudoxanthomonas suwonensis]